MVLIDRISEKDNNINDIKLFDYQATILANMIDFEYDNTDKLGFLNLPSGIGKTVISLALSKNNGLSMFVIPETMMNNYTHRLDKYKISFENIFSDEEITNWDPVNTAFNNINIVVTIPRYYNQIIKTGLLFDRIIFDDIKLDMNYLSLSTKFTWVILADIDEYINHFPMEMISKCSILLSVELLNVVFQFENVATTVIKCKDSNFTKAVKLNNSEEVLDCGFEEFSNRTHLKSYMANIMQSIENIEPYNQKIVMLLKLIKLKQKVIIFTESNHEYLEKLIKKKINYNYKSLEYNNYDDLNKFNNKTYDGLIVNPNVKGISLVSARFAFMFENTSKSVYENCIGRIMRKSRDKSLKLVIYKLEFEI
jgi:hypothetical protein